jgi:nucleoside-triphosphatase THEP1
MTRKEGTTGPVQSSGITFRATAEREARPADGPPGCGKTTAVLRLVGRLVGLRLAGFYTGEPREGGHRVGFEAVGLSTGGPAPLAHVRSRSRLRVGRYGVEAAAFAEVGARPCPLT